MGWQEQVWLFLLALNFYKITPWGEMFPQGSSALEEPDPELGQLDSREDVESFSCFVFSFLFKHYSLISVHVGLEGAVHPP